ncbi:MAG: N-acetyl sugar amidotransferase [Anaerolineae bacterium]|nr:N-acetyl sugar amidotransferase [Anaerolineae bacterium]
MRYIKYCKRCIMPETKPDLYIDETGVCNACRNYERRQEIDWDQRRQELLAILERYRSKNGNNYDCVIPVSGGKDSHYQTLRILELGMNPLCVTATTDKLSAIGRRNIENLKLQGVDYVEVTVNPVVRRNINRLALTQVGDISWPEHVTIFTIPVRIAVQFNIPLIVWGENSQNEYGGPAAAAENNVLTRRWLEEFGGLLGLRVSDLIGQAGIEARHLIQYTYPSDEELQRSGVTGIFLGYYLPWDGYGNALFSQAHGFETYHQPVEGSLVNYENLDNAQTGIHDYFKFLKYGFGRATDLACMHVRRGRLSRNDAVKLVKKHDGKFPWVYLGVPLEEILDDIDMSLDEFVGVCDRFTNKKLFVCDTRGNLVKDRHGNLTKINYDNVASDDETTTLERLTLGYRMLAGSEVGAKLQD